MLTKEEDWSLETCCTETTSAKGNDSVSCDINRTKKWHPLHTFKGRHQGHSAVDSIYHQWKYWHVILINSHKAVLLKWLQCIGIIYRKIFQIRQLNYVLFLSWQSICYKHSTLLNHRLYFTIYSNDALDMSCLGLSISLVLLLKFQNVASSSHHYLLYLLTKQVINNNYGSCKNQASQEYNKESSGIWDPPIFRGKKLILPPPKTPSMKSNVTFPHTDCLFYTLWWPEWHVSSIISWQIFALRVFSILYEARTHIWLHEALFHSLVLPVKWFQATQKSFSAWVHGQSITLS